MKKNTIKPTQDGTQNVATFTTDETNMVPNPNMTTLQEQARLTVLDGSTRIAPYQPTPINLDDAGAHKGANTNETKKRDPSESPVQGFVKRPDMPASPNNEALKVHT